MKKETIEKYHCAIAHNERDLNMEVEKWLAHGYLPIGGVSVSVCVAVVRSPREPLHYKTTYAQAMVLYAK